MDTGGTRTELREVIAFVAVSGALLGSTRHLALRQVAMGQRGDVCALRLEGWRAARPARRGERPGCHRLRSSSLRSR